MPDNGHDYLADILARNLSSDLRDAGDGHCLRIDDIDDRMATSLIPLLRGELGGSAAVHILRAAPEGPYDITPERAIEIRNRKATVVLLFVPVGEGHAASSLDNSFKRVPALDLYSQSEASLRRGIADEQLATVLQRHRRWLKPKQDEAWVEFLSELCVEPTLQRFGELLWRVGLVPDRGPDPDVRLERNRLATRAISSPGRPSAAINERMSDGGLQEGPWRAPLRSFLEQRGATLASPIVWTRDIALRHPALTFDNWRLAEAVEEDLDSLTIEPFTRPDGKVERLSKLETGPDGQPLLRVPLDGHAPIRVRWKTIPPRIAGVARWHVEVVLPADMRSEDNDPLASVTVGGDTRTSTVQVSVDEDALAAGSRFVVRVRAVGEHGEFVSLISGEPAEADSEEFQIVTGEDTETRIRRAAASSVAESLVRAACDGIDDLTEDFVTWDLDGQVFGFRLGSRRGVQIRVSAALIRAQRLLIESADHPSVLSWSGVFGTPLDFDQIERSALTLPKALSDRRGAFLMALKARHPRDAVEAVQWDEELTDLATAYLAAYRRALDAADPRMLEELLRYDTITLRIRRNNKVIRAVVCPALHPIRLGWVRDHDQLLRKWATQLTETPRNARNSMVDTKLLQQVVPANLPFTVMSDDLDVATYVEELTHGSGLYLVPGDVEAEAACEAVASVLELDRTSSTMRATSHLLAERIEAYRQSHDPSGTLRMVVVNPGAGDLIATALAEGLETSVGNDDNPDQQHQLEVISYTDNAAYIRPVAALARLQDRLRNREFAHMSSHLFPPMSLTVRPLDRLVDDYTTAHLAVVQDLGGTATGLTLPDERTAIFSNLLVPVVTRTRHEGGDLVWESAPSNGVRNTRADGVELALAHRSHQRGVARVMGATEGHVPCTRVVLDGSRQARISVAHERADWVIGLDRFIGVDLYESASIPGMPESYILDYAPDFVEGIGDRLTVTTTRRAEVEELLRRAMNDLGLRDVNRSVGSVLQTLTVVSGRLALRLLENTSLAREAVSLAAVVAYLRERGDLEDTIVIPVDAHPEIFGPTGSRESGRRCDLLLVRIGQRSFKIECVEVKSRAEARMPQSLAQQIVDQVTDTKTLLESRYFAADPPRIDLDLQRARLTSLLHYYADRSSNHGLVSPERLDDIHKYIDRVSETGESADITLRGFVISLNGEQGFDKRYGDVALSVLTAEDLMRIGFTTPQPDATPREVPQIRSGESPSLEDEVDPVPEIPMITNSSGSITRGGDGLGQPAAGEPIGEGAAVSREVAQDEDHRQPVETGSPEEVDVTLGHDAGGSPVHWRLSTKGSPHAFVIGIPGQGKSVTTRRIIRNFSEQGLATLVFDFHGDMAANPPEGARVIDAARGLPFNPFEPEVGIGRPINTTAWEIAEIVGHVAGLGTIQQNHVYKALISVYAAHGWVGTTVGSGTPTISEFAEAVEVTEAGAKGRNARDRLRPFTDFGLFVEESSEGFRIREHGRDLVFDVSKIGLEEVQRFAASFLLRRVYREMFSWDQDGTLKLAVVLDEAHRLARDVTLPKVMKEGRKYGLSVVVASQSADDFHKDVLGNAGTKIIFRTNYPASRGVAGYLRGRNGLDLAQDIERLGVGVAFVATSDRPQAIRVNMSE